MWLLETAKKAPSFIIWTVAFLLGMIIYLSDLAASKIFGFEKRGKYVRRGHCLKNGLCCHVIGVTFPKSWIKQNWCVRLINQYYKSIHNFSYIGLTNGNMLVFECGYLSKENTCQIHPFRPKICREYPVLTLGGARTCP